MGLSWCRARTLIGVVTAALFGACQAEMIVLRRATDWPAGALVANVGMTLPEVRERSSLELGGSFDDGDMQITSDETLFDLEVAGTGVRIERCGFYLLRTRGENWRVDEVTAFVTRRNLSRAAVDAATAAVHQMLAADGWTRGRSESRGPDDPSSYWLKDDILFTTERFRTDRHDRQPAEDPRTAGKFFLIVRVATLDEVERLRLTFPGPQPSRPAGVRQGGSPGG